MLEQVAEALKSKDYTKADSLLQNLVNQQQQNPLVQLYLGQLHEGTGKLDLAENIYRQLLQTVSNQNVLVQARQGLQRLEDFAREQRRQAIAQAISNVSDRELGVLILESIDPDMKGIAAPDLARIMQIDRYTARLQLPSRGWRLYRSGAVGEMRFYAQQLQQAKIKSFSAAMADLEAIEVFQVNYLQPMSTQCLQAVGSYLASSKAQKTEDLTRLNFDWSQVSQRVEGLLPIFEEVVDRDVRNKKLLRKTKILDYVGFCDLHLPHKRTILRLCDRHYQFQLGIALPEESGDSQPLGQATNRKKWNKLVNLLHQQLSEIPVCSDFSTFAETVIDRVDLLEHIESHINLFRRQESVWDPAFHLYSGLAFLRQNLNLSPQI
ncbi:MAG: tetratricopeptide repeat protein [Cyanosarcina radialis HA8281-LM2]|jgi:tetratricopeptide (TPR) repeat protein|nr:tetratricopeptide repeat protein [Cyanosarcina radialis HA8281-LM2]